MIFQFTFCQRSPSGSADSRWFTALRWCQGAGRDRGSEVSLGRRASRCWAVPKGQKVKGQRVWGNLWETVGKSWKIWENLGKSIINSEIFSWENHQKKYRKIPEIDIGQSPTKIRRFEIDGNIIKLNFRKNPRLMTPGGTWAQDLGKIWEARNGEYWNYSLVI